jgi:prophage DNA circulation protein
MSSWATRTRTEITFISPSGQRFRALWRANSITTEKKLGIFEFPRFNGTVVQDLGVKGRQFPLTIYFEGENADLDAQKFEGAMAEDGVWSVNHPTRGPLVLQPVNCSPMEDPTDSGNVWVVDTNWIESTDQSSPGSAPEAAALANSQIHRVNAVAGQQFARVVSTRLPSELTALRAAVSSVVTQVSRFIGEISKAVAEIEAAVTSIKQGIDEVLNAAFVEPLMLAGQIQQLIQLPSQIAMSVGSKIDTYGKIAAAIFNVVPAAPTAAGRNVAAVADLTYTAIFGALTGVGISGEYISRAAAVQTAEYLSNQFIDVTNHLDEIQEMYSENLITTQYFSQSESFSVSSRMMYLTIAYLLSLSFNLPVEKRITLTRPRAPIEITITEYGGLGPQDSLFDFFITTNHLKGNEILILPVGRQVVVYV